MFCWIFVSTSSWGLLNRLNMLPWSPLRFSIIGKSILRTFTFLLTNFQPSPNFNPIPTTYHNKDIVFVIFDNLDDHKKMRDLRTIIFHPVSRRDLSYVSENEGFRFRKKDVILMTSVSGQMAHGRQIALWSGTPTAHPGGTGFETGPPPN